MIETKLYLDERGRSPFEKWRSNLDGMTRARISRALERLLEGNTSNVRGLSGGVSELKIDAGPGYRIYFGREGQHIVILLGGGTKKRQQADIVDALERWKQYKKRNSWHAADQRLQGDRVGGHPAQSRFRRGDAA